MIRRIAARRDRDWRISAAIEFSVESDLPGCIKTRACCINMQRTSRACSPRPATAVADSGRWNQLARAPGAVECVNGQTCPDAGEPNHPRSAKGFMEGEYTEQQLQRWPDVLQQSDGGI